MKYKAFRAAVWCCLLLIVFPSDAYANSSWHWVTASPLKVLPFAIILTLLVETVSIAIFGKVADYKKVFVVVCLANLLSFLAPYLERAYRFIPTSGGFSITAAFDKGPYYIVLMGYLLLTIIVELPAVFLMLRKDSANKNNLIASILLSNIVTTLLVAVSERMICQGRW